MYKWLRSPLLALLLMVLSCASVSGYANEKHNISSNEFVATRCSDQGIKTNILSVTLLHLCQYRRQIWQNESIGRPNLINGVEPIVVKAQTSTLPQNDARSLWWTVIYQKLINNNWEIESSTNNAYTRKQITSNTYDDLHPSFNYGATKIAFESDRDGNAEIYTMNADGTSQERLTTNSFPDRLPDWSSGDQIVFVSQRDGNDEIYVMYSDGSAQRRLTINDTVDTFPIWSPDSKQIAWIQTDGNSTGVIWLMNADGSEQRSITTPLLYLSHLAWSPDGQRLAFDYDGDQDGLNRIASMRTDGSELQFVDGTPGYPTTLNDHWAGSWSPDGANIIYTDVQLQLLNNDIVIATMIVRSLCLDSQRCYSFDTTYNAFSSAPNIENADPFPPTSSVQPLPEYSRMQQFTVNWSGYDIGPAGIANFDIQYRREDETEWQDWLTDVLTTRGTPPISSPTKWYFRSRAEDEVGNVEAWSPGSQGDASTSLFAWNLDGIYTDARGNPITNQAILVNSDTLSTSTQATNGNYSIKLPNTASYHINNSSNVFVDADQSHALYQEPKSNLIVNGGFEQTQEARPANWLFSAAVTQTLSLLSAYQGNQSLHLGYQCLFPCLDSGVTKSFGQVYATSTYIKDREGNLHVLTPIYTKGLNYQRYTINHQWDSEMQLFNNGNYSEVASVHPIIDSKGRLNIMVTTDNSPLSQRIYYTRKTASGIFLTPLDLGYSSSPELAYDAADNLHILYLKYPEGGVGLPSLYYRIMYPDTRLSTGVKISELNERWGYDLAVDSSGVAHVYWSKFGYPQSFGDIIYHTTIAPDGTQSTSELHIGADRIGQIVYLQDRNVEHLFWQEGVFYYWMYKEHEQWSDPMIIHQISPEVSGYVWPRIFSYNDLLYWYLSPSFGSDGIVRFLKENRWSSPQKVEARRFYSLVPIRGEQGEVLLGVTTDNYDHIYATSLTSPQSKDFSAAQRLIIPTEIHQPTLSFMYNLETNASERSYFEVRVSDELSENQVFSTTKSTSWQQGWVDITPWQGKTITVTFNVHQAISDSYIQVDLDAVTLGPWTTPQPKTATPTQIDLGSQQTITISGNNFIDAPVVQLGKYALTSVLWVNEHELRGQIPVGIPPGVYNIVVTNPDGQSNSSISVIMIGKQVYLPLISN